MSSVDALLHPSPEQLPDLVRNIRALERAPAEAPFHAFQLGCARVLHSDLAEVAAGVALLERYAVPLVRSGDDPDTLRDTYFYLAIGHTKLGSLDLAESAADRMLRMTPDHPQGRALLAAIDAKRRKADAATLAIAVGVGAAAAGLLGAVGGALLARSRR